MNIQKVTENFSVSDQITTEDLTQIAALGFKAVINNRPDFESGPDQPTSEAIKVKATELGLAYMHIPVIPNNIMPDQVNAFTHAFGHLPKPILGFCRTGNRASKMLALSQAQQASQ
jgi:uncharacterized protein (TIGR01244 family)